MDTDACDHQHGATLFQTQSDEEPDPFGIWYRALLFAEWNCFVPEKECFSVVWAFQTLHLYLQSEQFTVHSDQASLPRLMGITESSGRQMPWRLGLSKLLFEIVSKEGKLNAKSTCYPVSRPYNVIKSHFMRKYPHVRMKRQLFASSGPSVRFGRIRLKPAYPRTSDRFPNCAHHFPRDDQRARELLFLPRFTLGYKSAKKSGFRKTKRE